jgi:hypothetical protein
MTFNPFYYRHECGLIEQGRIGFQWWHGPNFFFRSKHNTIYIAGFGHGFCREVMKGIT